MQWHRMCFYLLNHSPNGHNGRVWARPQPAVKSFILFSHMGSSDSGVWDSICCPPRMKPVNYSSRLWDGLKLVSSPHFMKPASPCSDKEFSQCRKDGKTCPYLCFRMISHVSPKMIEVTWGHGVGKHPEGLPWQSPVPVQIPALFSSNPVPSVSWVNDLWYQSYELIVLHWQFLWNRAINTKPQEEAVQNIHFLFKEEFIFTSHFLYLFSLPMKGWEKNFKCYFLNCAKYFTFLPVFWPFLPSVFLSQIFLFNPSSHEF